MTAAALRTAREALGLSQADFTIAAIAKRIFRFMQISLEPIRRIV